VAEDLAHEQPLAVTAAPEARKPERGSTRPTQFGFRFAFAYLALALVAGAAIGLTVVLADRPAEKKGLVWSAWQPTGRQTSYAEQIAEHVARGYRLQSGGQLAAVIAGPPELGGVPVQAVAIHHESPVPNVLSQDEVIETGNTVMYALCGLGAQCSAPDGNNTFERLQVLQREALELSLYSFKYVEGAESTIVLLPPDLGESAEDPADDVLRALFFEAKDFRRELTRPLRQTLLSPTPPQGAELNPREGLIVDRLTDPNLFQYEFQQIQTGGAILVLAPINARR
jgi:hypothetical protein